jgi:hypothetical protein
LPGFSGPVVLSLSLSLYLFHSLYTLPSPPPLLPFCTRLEHSRTLSACIKRGFSGHGASCQPVMNRACTAPKLSVNHNVAIVYECGTVQKNPLLLYSAGLYFPAYNEQTASLTSFSDSASTLASGHSRWQKTRASLGGRMRLKAINFSSRRVRRRFPSSRCLSHMASGIGSRYARPHVPNGTVPSPHPCRAE